MQSKLQKRLRANRVVGFMPFRDHCSSMPGKHSWDLCGRPVYYWKLRAALECKYLEKILVWTEVEEALTMAKEMSDKFIIRKRKLSECREPESIRIDDLRTSQSEESIYSGINRRKWYAGFWGSEAEDAFGFMPSVSVNLSVNSPLEIGDDFDRLVEAYFNADDADGVQLVQEINPDIVIKTPEGYAQPLWYWRGVSRQQTISLYALTGTELVGFNRYFHRWKSILVEISKERAVHIHTKEDLDLARFYLQKRLNK